MQMLRPGPALCFVLGTKLPAEGRQGAVNSTDCHGCDTARWPPLFLLSLYSLLEITSWPKAEAGAA